jgi:hypothetical protein
LFLVRPSARAFYFKRTVENQETRKMRSKSFGWFTRTLALAAALFVMLPTFAFAQNGDWRDEQRRERRRERREDRRDRRRDRRDDRRDRRDDRRDDNWGGWGRNNGGWGGYGGNSRQTALNAGYNEGIKEGRNDRQRGDRYDFRDESDYRNANKDYNSRLGDRGTYQRYFRQGFENGYRDGYRGY